MIERIVDDDDVYADITLTIFINGDSKYYDGSIKDDGDDHNAYDDCHMKFLWHSDNDGDADGDNNDDSAYHICIPTLTITILFYAYHISIFKSWSSYHTSHNSYSTCVCMHAHRIVYEGWCINHIIPIYNV